MDLKDIRLYVDDRPAEGVFRVHRDVYSDPELFELEQKFIFERTWNFIALESQIARPNDFVTGHIGRTPVLATRDAKGRLGGFVNGCRHKGAIACAAEGDGVYPGAFDIHVPRQLETAARQRPGSLPPDHDTPLLYGLAGAAPRRGGPSGGAPVRLGEARERGRGNVRVALRPCGDLAQ